MKKLFLVLIIIPFALNAQSKRAMTVEDLWAMKRISHFDVSADGQMIIFSAASYDMEENKGNTDIYIINSDGSNLRSLKNSEKNETNPKFVPGSNKISYLMDGQIWLCNYDGTNDKKLTDIYTKVSDYKWSSSGNKILFTSSVYPECTTQDCNKSIDDEREASKVKAKLFTQLTYRHWNDWRGDKRSHLFLLDVDSGNFTDLTEGNNEDVPPLSLGSSNDFNFSPDETEVAFTMNPDFSKATNTNNEIYLLNFKSPSSPKLISTSKGVDCQPVYSPDGKYLAWTSMKRAGFEADKLDIVLYDRAEQTQRILTDKYDLSVSEFIWADDSKSIYFNSNNEVNKSIFKIDIEKEIISTVFNDYVNSDLKMSSDGKQIYFKQQRSNLPQEIFSVEIFGKRVKQVTSLNSERLAQLETNPVETFWSDGEDGVKVQSILVKPPFFDANKKYPMIFLIHGGPQGNWSDNFHYRWNMQLFASQGYVVVAPNPRGSTGYGQKFTDEISLDWAGKVYTDLINAYDYALENFNFIDSKNTFAAGASYGGYMINWIAGNTDRFNALVSHAGVFNLESMYGTTEELWFPEWEFGGTPWQNRELYEKWSPHRYIHNAKTPVLIIHGAFDFRVSEEQAFQLFTSLQRLGVESRFLYFPDETHFITKPQNAKLWWNTVFNWFMKFYKKEDL